MKEAGVELVADFSWAGAIGIVESLRLVPRLLGEQSKLKRIMVERRPDVFVPIDFGAFNVPLGRFAREHGVKTVYYFPPGSWRKRPRDPANLLAASDRIITPFPWSEKLLTYSGADATFPGHPMLDRVAPSLSREEFCKSLGIAPDCRVVGLLPGSRAHEINNIMPALLKSGMKVSALLPDVGAYLIAAGSDGAANNIQSIIRRSKSRLPFVKIVRGLTYDVMAHSDLVITCSGTATLETMILGTPMVIVYRGSKLMKLEYLFRKRILEDFIGMPNIVAGRSICPELLGDKASPEEISRAAIELLTSRESLNQMKADLRSSREMLGEPGGTRRAAYIVLETAGLCSIR